MKNVLCEERRDRRQKRRRNKPRRPAVAAALVDSAEEPEKSAAAGKRKKAERQNGEKILRSSARKRFQIRLFSRMSSLRRSRGRAIKKEGPFLSKKTPLCAERIKISASSESAAPPPSKTADRTEAAKSPASRSSRKTPKTQPARSRTPVPPPAERCRA